MEALVGVGLASNVLQFVDFSTKLVSKARELGQDAASSDHKDYDALATHLKVLAEKVGASAHSIAQSQNAASPEERALQPIADGCCELSNKLLERLSGLGLLSAQSGSLLRRGKAAWRWVWNKKETEEIAERLHHFGSQLNLHLTYQTKQAQLEQRTWQSSKHDTEAILVRTNDVLDSVNRLRLGVHEKLDRQHGEVLNSIDMLRNLSLQSQAQTRQEATTSSQTTSDRIDGLESSVRAMMLKQSVEINSQRSEILESLATVRVENSAFHSQVTQLLPQTHTFDSSSLRNVFKWMLDECQEIITTDTRKELRGTALSEMEILRTRAFQAFDTIPQPAEARVQDSGEPMAEPPSMYSSIPVRGAEVAEDVNPIPKEHQGPKKNDTAVTYIKNRRVSTRIGTFVLQIRDKVIFDPVKPPVSVYELTTHFIPSPRWYSKSLSVTYQNMTDARGTPRFGLQFQSYRVLDANHEIWKAILKDDIDVVRGMLAERVVSPSDIDEQGGNLLLFAIHRGHLDIVKALVHSGADINIVHADGMSPICWAILRCIMFNKSGQDYDQGYDWEMFYYFQGLSNINMQDLWLNRAIISLAVYYFMLFSTTDATHMQNNLLNWVSLCRAVDIDFDCAESTFLETIIRTYGNKYVYSPWTNLKCFDSIAMFDLVFDQVVYTCPTIASEIPIFYTAKIFFAHWNDAHVAKSASAIMPVLYHGYYVTDICAKALSFLEHVMIKAIAQRPDCIFDHGELYKNHEWTVCQMFEDFNCWDIWADILEDKGFDPNWVLEEDKKRRRARTTKTSTHEVVTEVDASQALQVKRRKGFVNAEE